MLTTEQLEREAIHYKSELEKANAEIARLKPLAASYCDGCPDLEKANATIQKQEGEIEELRSFIEREGYRRCDIMACNCNGYHGGNAYARLVEIARELDNNGIDTNGKTILIAISESLAELTSLRLVKEAAELHLENCKKDCMCDSESGCIRCCGGEEQAKAILAGRGPTK